MSYSKEKAKELAELFLSDYNNDSNVKEALTRLGFKIVPNSLKLIIEGLEKAGYSVTLQKKEEPILPILDNPDSSIQPTVENKEQPDSTELKLAPKDFPPLPPKLELNTLNESPTEESKNESIPLFLGRKLEEENNGFHPIDTPTTEQKEQNAIDSIPPKEEGKDDKVYDLKSEDFLLIWKKILEDIKSLSVPIFSLVNKAIVLEINNEYLTIGYGTEQSYLLRQFISRIKDDKQSDKIDDLISQAFNQPLKLRAVLESDFKHSIETEIEKQPTDNNHNINLPLFGGR